MSENKDHSTMGLPRVSGKRRWSAEEEDGDGMQSSPKAICTSPPYALCAEDVLPDPPLSRPHPSSSPSPPRTSPSPTPPSTDCIVNHDDKLEDASLLPTEGSTEDLIEDAEEDSSIDDEDRDSGFIDGNSIDNSDDDDDNVSESKNDALCNNLGSNDDIKSSSIPETDLQISLSKILPNSASSLQSLVSESSADVKSIHSPTSTVSTLSSVSTDYPKYVENEIETSTSSSSMAQVEQAVVPSPQISYNLQCYPTPCSTTSSTPTSYPSDLYETRPCASTWSCTFYDGSHPSSTNKYMEISPPSRGSSLSSQNIQCDENGKSYLELGGASPYNSSTYENECTNFANVQSSYSNSYSSFSGNSTPPASYTNNNGYFNNRPSPPCTPPPFLYHRSSESYNGYETENSGYSYSSTGYSTQPNGRILNVTRTQVQRCSSPVCDLTRTSPRPPCYHQQRLSMLNISMFKLNRFSRFPEPSLLRSVLICNTLRHIEREMEREGLNMGAVLSNSNAYGTTGHVVGAAINNGSQCLDPMPATSPVNNEGPLPSIHAPLIPSPVHSSPHPNLPLSNPPSMNNYTTLEAPLPCYSPYPHDESREPMSFDSLTREPYSLRPVTPNPQIPDRTLLTESSVEESDDSNTGNNPPRNSTEERIGGINWCSVLSLSSQSDLDSINNNECQEWSSESSFSSLSTTTTLTTLTTRSVNKTISAETTTVTNSIETSTSCGSDESSSSSWRLPSLSADDVLKSIHGPSRKPEDDIDSMINVLVRS